MDQSKEENIVKVKALEKEFDVLLNKYQEAINNYILSLNQDKTFVELKGRTWWGDRNLEEKNDVTMDECKDMCANNNKCTGATFNQVKRYCWTRAGNGKLSVGTNDDYALITNQKSSLEVLKSLNDQLLKLNIEIETEINNLSPYVNSQTEIKHEQVDNIEKHYQTLMDQKYKIDEELQEIYSIDKSTENEELVVNQKQSVYRIWAIVAFILLILTFFTLYGSNVPIFIVWVFILIVLLIILSSTLTKPSGFMFIFLFILFIMFMTSTYT
jgi:hypothetical protein